MPMTETEPADVPEWDPADPGRIEDPGAPKKAAGWDDGEAPPAKWFNWFWNLVYQWVLFIQDFINNSYSEQHNLVSGTHSDVTAYTIETDELYATQAEIGSTGQLTISGTGELITSDNITATTINGDNIIASAGMESPTYTWADPGHLTFLLQPILQTDPMAKTGDTAGALVASDATYNTPRIFLDNNDGCVLPFRMNSNTDLDGFRLFIYPSGGTAYSINWEIVQWVDGAWVAVDATLDGNVADTGLVDGAMVEATASLADFGGPNVAGHGMHVSSPGIYGIRLVNISAIDVGVALYEPRVWVYTVEQALGAL